MNDIVKLFDFIRFSDKLKLQNRDIKLPDGRLENVAEHSWHATLFAMLVHPYIETKVDLLRSLKMLLIHDIVETDIGDIPYYKTHDDPDAKKKKELAEKKEIEKIKDMLPKLIGKEVFDLWHEFEEKKTPEAKFAKAIDSIQADYQATLFGDISYWDDPYYDFALTKSLKHTKHDKFLKNMNKELNKRIIVELEKIGFDYKDQLIK